MKTSLAQFIAFRYSRAARSHFFVSFISLISMVGIAIGVMVLITVLSVMNGFNVEVRSRILSMTPHLVVTESHGLMKNADKLMTLLAHEPEIIGMAPYLDGQGMLTRARQMHGVVVRGIEPALIDEVYPLSAAMVMGQMADLSQTPYGVLMGYTLAARLNVVVGDKVTLIVPEATVSLAGINPRMRQVTVVGIYDSGHFYDSTHVFMTLADVSTLYRTDAAVTGVQCRLRDPLGAPRLSALLEEDYGLVYDFEPWTFRHSHYFEAVKMEKTMMFFILLLIVAVAAFNLVASLVMMVADKQTDIAIMRAMGASKRLVMAIFIWQGALVGLMGTLLGVLAGVALSLHVTEIVNFIELLMGQQLIAADVYFLDYLPSQLLFSDIALVTTVAFFMSLLATLYPAWRAASIRPAEVLRYA